VELLRQQRAATDAGSHGHSGGYVQPSVGASSARGAGAGGPQTIVCIQHTVRMPQITHRLPVTGSS
jgi:hypothetical protein